ncbi:MAG: 5-deoxyadenosine deaminase [Gemmatimonadetes bacterium]|jgi:imidazolonepropionase-like amidohydrolase|nr:5-deoxyadenosine deaminase [Gemmatimonadota bacterium]
MSRGNRYRAPIAAAALLGAMTAFASTPLAAQAASSGQGPIAMGTTKGEKYSRLVLRNATIISGRGTPGTNRAMPPEGPVDIVIEGNKIVDILLADPVNVASAGGESFRPTGDRVIDLKGMYVMPGLVEMHAHLPGDRGELGARGHEYAFRLYLGHGVTAVRDAGTGAGMKFMAEQRRLSALNQTVAPRLILCQRWPLPLRSWKDGNTPDKARAMVRMFKEIGADCIKISKSPGQYPDVLEAAVDEGKKLGLHTMVDLKVSETDARVASNAGVRSIEHFYGFPEAGLTGSQSFPPDYNYWDEKYRFRWAGKLWKEGDQHPEKIVELLDLLIKNGTNWNPTLAPYEDNRDLARGRTLPFRETLFHPSQVDKLPDSTTHGGYHHDWKLSDELNWKEFYQIWFKYVKLFHDKGGLLTAGSDVGDAGGIFMIRELELLQEAGLPPLDIIKVATTNAYQTLGWKDHCGIRVGCVADLAVVNGNPLENFKVMYGRGYGYYGILPKAERETRGGVKWTIKDGVVFDSQALLREVEWYVQQERVRLSQPGAAAGSRHD